MPGTYLLPTKLAIGDKLSKTLFIDPTVDSIDAIWHLTHYMEFELFSPTTNVTVGNGKKYFHIPTELNGMNLVYVHAFVITAGTTNLTSVQIYNVTDAVNMLSTVCSIDSGETGSNTAATAAVIDTTHDDVATNDVLRIDVSAVQTTAPVGLIVTLGFQQP